MQVTIEQGEGLKRIIKVVVEASLVKSAFEKTIKELSKKMRVPGFRKGHIPANIVMQQRPGDVFDGTLDALARQAFNQVTSEHPELKIVDTPSVAIAEGTKFDPNGENTLAFTCEVMPERLSLDLKGRTLKQYECELTDEDVENMIMSLRQQRAVWQECPADTAAADGHRVNINFAGRIDGELFEGSSAKNYNAVIGRSIMIPGFLEQIAGHKAGDEFSIDVTFPEDYVESLRGKDATFDIKINSVAEQILPELNEAFFASFNVENEEVLRKELRNNMEREKHNRLMHANIGALAEALKEAAGDFVIPSIWIENSRQTMLKAEKDRMQRYLGKELPPVIKVQQNMLKDPQYRRKEAENQVRISWIFESFRAGNNITSPSDETVERELDIFASALEDPEHAKEELRRSKDEMNYIVEMALQEDIIACARNLMQVEYEKIPFGDLLVSPR